MNLKHSKNGKKQRWGNLRRVLIEADTVDIGRLNDMSGGGEEREVVHLDREKGYWRGDGWDREERINGSG